MKRLVRILKRRWWLILLIIGLSWLTYRNRYEVAEWVRDRLGIQLPEDPRPAGLSDLEWCEQNYRDEIAALAQEHNLSYPYLMSLIILECGGNKPADHRYESHVYRQLKKLKDGKRRKFENIRADQLTALDDEGLKNLATSWGPFQLMGYKAIPLGVNVSDLRNEETAAEVGVAWIEQEYGHFIRKKKYKDAFHYHNTGKRFPLSGRSRTHDPYYVSDGIRYMKYYEKHNPLNPEGARQ
jgi:hypothetical protein